MIQVSVDIGGTFTDCLVHESGEPLGAFKSSTVPSDPTQGVLDALAKAAAASGQDLSGFLARVGLFVHGTTLGTNVLLTRNGATLGFLTTRGFRDQLEIRRGIRNLNRSMFDQFHPPFEPLVPRYHRVGVPERIRYDGQVIERLDVEAVEREVRQLVLDGCDSIAIGFLHAQVNPEHELLTREIVERIAPEVYVVCSHEILRSQGEFERFSATAISAYIGPAIAKYLRRLEDRLKENGLDAPLLIMQSSGLMQTVEECVDRAVELLVSGPAAAPYAALTIGSSRGQESVIEVDMGGTSFDICVVRDGTVPTTKDAWVGEDRVPTKLVDVVTIGAGGGSIAGIDSLGLLRVGPQSAGADPGPAAYGRSELATVTDADLVLGYLSPDYFLGGEMSLDLDRSTQALAEVGKGLDMDARDTALAVFKTINTVMANGITEACTKKGLDVRDFTIVAGGGAGGLHAASVAEIFQSPEVIFPMAGPLLSAMGMMTMDIGRELSRSIVWDDPQNISPETMADAFNEMVEELDRSFADAEVSREDIAFRRTVEVRYEGQYHEVEIPVPEGHLDSGVISGLVAQFHSAYEDLYGYSMPWQAVEFLGLHLRASAPRGVPFELAVEEADDTTALVARREPRECLIETGPQLLEVYDRSLLRPGHSFAGPALVDSPTTTVLVPEAFDAEVDQHLNLVLTLRTSKRPIVAAEGAAKA